MIFCALSETERFMAVTDAFLVTRPDYDIVTKYFCVWSQPLIAMAKKKGMRICDLQGKKATRAQFESYIRKNKPSLIFLNGHGNTEVIAGNDDQVLADRTTVLPGAVVYARSCDAGEGLGPMLVVQGARSFIGYRRKFIFGYTAEFITRPFADPMAALFLEPSNLVISTLLKGHAASDAHHRSRDAMFRNFKKMICSTASFEERYASRWLWGNLQHQVLIGDDRVGFR